MPTLMCPYLIGHLYISDSPDRQTYLSNTTVNIQDIVSLRSGSPDLHESSIMDWVGAGVGKAGKNHLTSRNTLVQNHAAMLWSLKHIRIMWIKTRWQKTSQLSHCSMQIWCIFKKRHGHGWGGAWLKLAPSHRDRPAFCIWPSRGERQLCVWCHSLESHQSHTGRNTS